MAKLILFNKPYQVLSQFSDKDGKSTLADYIKVKSVYPAGRLDYDSEGLLLLTNDGQLQHQISHPNHKQPKTYWVQVEGVPSQESISQLQKGVLLKDGPTLPAKVRLIDEPNIWPRVPPIRERQNQPTSWLEIIITEGRNRQVRRMTAAIGYPTLRLVRSKIGNWDISDIPLGEYNSIEIHMPNPQNSKSAPKNHSNRKRHNNRSPKFRK